MLHKSRPLLAESSDELRYTSSEDREGVLFQTSII